MLSCPRACMHARAFLRIKRRRCAQEVAKRAIDQYELDVEMPTTPVPAKKLKRLMEKVRERQGELQAAVPPPVPDSRGSTFRCAMVCRHDRSLRHPLHIIKSASSVGTGRVAASSPRSCSVIFGGSYIWLRSPGWLVAVLGASFEEFSEIGAHVPDVYKGPRFWL